MFVRFALLVSIFTVICYGQENIQGCTPPCRTGYTCVNGQCVSQCNPPCPEGTTCIKNDCVKAQTSPSVTSSVNSVNSENPPRIADCNESTAKGETAASSNHSSAGWFLGGVGSGVLLGLIGTGIITVSGAMSNPQPHLLPEEVNQECYISGYRGKAKSKNTWSALGGGLVGTLAWVLIIVAASSN